MSPAQRVARALSPTVEAFVRERGAEGATWAEVASALGVHHGTASGALSRLHGEGRLSRLAEKRGRSRVYVVPECVHLRPTEERSPHVCRVCRQARA